jgi:hypothetical protein
MTELPSEAWRVWYPALYKFRELGSRATQIVENLQLYFAPIRDMTDRTEVGAQLIISEDPSKIVKHLDEYLSVLKENRTFEYELFQKQMARYHDDIMAPFRAGRRNARVLDFDARIKHATQLIADARATDGPAAVRQLQTFYENIRSGLREATVCCLAKTPKAPKMWEEYAKQHRGVCFQFSNRIFVEEKKIERVDVLYTSDGKLHPLELGYSDSYRALFSTKHASYIHEEEVRFFIFGDPRPVPVKSPELTAVILGSEALSPSKDPDIEASRRTSIYTLAFALDQRNRRRNPEHRTPLYIASWVGYELHVRHLSTAQLLDEYR